jgi:hypothetical protein
MSRLRKVVGWVLVVYGVLGTLDRIGYFPTAWFSNPIKKIVDFFSVNPILYFLYLVFPLVMLILGLIILMSERLHSKEKRKQCASTLLSRLLRFNFVYLLCSQHTFGFQSRFNFS